MKYTTAFLTVALVVCCILQWQPVSTLLDSPLIRVGEYDFNYTLTDGFEIFWSVSHENGTIEFGMKSIGADINFAAFAIDHGAGGMDQCDCFSMYKPLANGTEVRVADVYLNGNGVAKRDVDWGGTDDILQYTGIVTQDGTMHAKFIRSLHSTDKYDKNITDTLIGISWGRGTRAAPVAFHSKGKGKGSSINFLALKPPAPAPAPFHLFPFHWILITTIILLLVACALLVTYTNKSNTLYYYLFKRYTVTTKYSWINDVLKFSLGEIAVVLAYFSVALIWFLYEVFANDTVAVGKALGYINVLNISLVLLPVTRHSVWTWIFNISYERAIRFHRFLAASNILSVTIHFIAMMIYYGKGPQGAKGIRQLFVWSRDYSINPLPGFLAWLALLGMSVLALPIVRRKAWDIFQICHIFGAVIVFIFAHIHTRAKLLLPFTILSIVLYISDLLVRYLAFIGNRNITAVWKHNLFSSVRSCKIQAHTDIGITTVKLTLDRKLIYNRTAGSTDDDLLQDPVKRAELELQRMCLGKYVYLWIWEVSAWQSHPFSITEVYLTDINTVELTLNIKSMGTTSIGIWTSKLFKLASSGFTELTARFDGPFGTLTVPLDESNGAQSFDLILLFAGGIGITPLYGLTNYCLRYNQNTYLKWTVPRVDHTQILPSLLPIRDNVTVYTTQASTDIEPDSVFRVGRPNIEQVIMEQVQSITNCRRVGVAICGPTSMIHDVWKACSSVQRKTKSQFHIHTETFEI
jgi:ferric-chelate reductase